MEQRTPISMTTLCPVAEPAQIF